MRLFKTTGLLLALSVLSASVGAAEDRILAQNEAAPAAAGGGPCSFITQDEMAALLGKPVTRQEEPTGNRCVYYTEDPLVYVDLEIDRESAAQAWKGVDAGNEVIGAAQDDVAGPGEQVFFGPRDRLYVLSGDAFLAIEAGFDDKARERAKEVAALALDKLR